MSMFDPCQENDWRSRLCRNPIVPLDSNLNLTGMVIGHYKIVQKIGVGSFGVTYQAINLENGNTICCLKFFSGDGLKMMESFFTEAKILSKLNKLNTPEIIRILSIATTRSGYLVIVLEFICGKNLEDLLRIGPFSCKKALSIIGSVAKALLVLHENGLVHRDVKPANIMVTATGDTKLIDFGLVANLNCATKYPAGSPSYMDPEQLQWPSVGTEVYSLGITFYQILTGKTPFHAENLRDLFWKHENEELPLENVPIPVRKIVSKMCHKQQNRRYTSMLELIGDINICKNRLQS